LAFSSRVHDQIMLVPSPSEGNVANTESLAIQLHKPINKAALSHIRKKMSGRLFT
jgi:hypothetical protein